MRLRTQIKRRGVTQRHISRRTGIPEWRLSRLLNGELRARPRERRAIADALGLSVAALFRRRRREQPKTDDS